MSRVERKRLEREAKKKERKFSFGLKSARNEEPDFEINSKSKHNNSGIINEDRKQINNGTSDIKIDNADIKKDISNRNINEEKINFEREKIDKKDPFDKRFTLASQLVDEGSSSDDSSYNQTKRMITADRIISVEDERMYFERKRRNAVSNGKSSENVMTVDDIMTAEDEKNFADKPKVEVTKESEEKKIENSIYDIKKLDIDHAPYEDVVKVAESRLAADEEKKMEEERKRQEEKERLAREKAEQDRIEREKVEKQKLEWERAEKERVEKEKAEKARLDKEKAEMARVESEKLEKENAQKAKLESEKAEKERLAKINSEKIEPDAKQNFVANEKVEISSSKPDSSSSSGESTSNIDADEPKKSGFMRGFKKFLGGLVALILIVYAIGCVVFNGRFLPNTKVNGIDASFKTPAQIETLAENKVDGFVMTVKGRNNIVDKISGKDVDMKYIKGNASKIKSEQGFLTWPIALFKDSNISGKLNVEINEAKLTEIEKGLNIYKKENIKAPVSAFPRFDAKTMDFVIDKGNNGSTPIEKNVNNFLKESLIAQASEQKYPDSVYTKQKNSADDPRIQKAIDFMKEYTKHKIVYNYEYEKYTIDGKQISTMFDVNTEGDYSVKLSRDKVREVVRTMSRKYSTYGDTREIQSASTGGKLKVSGGVYGWLIDREKETDALMKIVEEKKNVDNRVPIYQQEAISRGKNDMGNEFIEIDLSKQRMWFVRDGQPIVSTYIVSGNPNQGDATPTGIYPVSYKTRHATLRGPGYASPVSYWIPFNGNIGIHDASWQPAYGGSRYLYAGSHGCINTPFSKVAQIYALAKKGIPVVVHH